MVSVVDRVLVPVFAVALNVTVPSPLPLAPPVIVSQLAGLLAVQAHPVPAATFTDPFDALAGSEALAADNVGAHATE
jgi:hypothetical protein